MEVLRLETIIYGSFLLPRTTSNYPLMAHVQLTHMSPPPPPLPLPTMNNVYDFTYLSPLPPPAFFTDMDYTLSASVLTFSSSTSTQCVTVNTANDTILEEDEQFGIQFNSTDRAVEILDPSPLRFIIVDDESKDSMNIMPPRQ